MSQIKITKLMAVEHEIVASTMCDLCGSQTPGEAWKLGLAGDESEIVEMSFCEEWNAEYNGGGDRTDTVFDICPVCWRSKIMPWMLAQGAQPRIEKSDW